MAEVNLNQSINFPPTSDDIPPKKADGWIAIVIKHEINNLSRKLQRVCSYVKDKSCNLYERAIKTYELNPVTNIILTIGAIFWLFALLNHFLFNITI